MLSKFLPTEQTALDMHVFVAGQLAATDQAWISPQVLWRASSSRKNRQNGPQQQSLRTGTVQLALVNLQCLLGLLSSNLPLQKCVCRWLHALLDLVNRRPGVCADVLKCISTLTLCLLSNSPILVKTESLDIKCQTCCRHTF